MGIVQSSSSLIGGTLAPVVTVALAASFGWRSSFYIIAIPGIIMGLILWKFLKEPKSPKVEQVSVFQAKPTKADYINVFKTRNVWLSTIVGICNMIYILTLTAFLPTIYAKSTNFGETKIGLLLGLMGLMMFIGQFGGAAISDRIGRLPAIKIFSLLAIFLPIAIVLSYNSFGLLLIAILIFSLGNGYQPLIMNIIPAESVSRTFSASAISFVILTSEIICGSFGPTLSGILADRYGLMAPLWVTAAAAFVGFLFTFGIRETAPIKLNQSRNKEIQAQV
jgi:predicted MFS family arabinose efflux permease